MTGRDPHQYSVSAAFVRLPLRFSGTIPSCWGLSTTPLLSTSVEPTRPRRDRIKENNVVIIIRGTRILRGARCLSPPQTRLPRHSLFQSAAAHSFASVGASFSGLLSLAFLCWELCGIVSFPSRVAPQQRGNRGRFFFDCLSEKPRPWPSARSPSSTRSSYR